MYNKYHYSDFTEEHYRDLIKLAKSQYAFAVFGDTVSIPHVLWRHDIDISPQRALKLAKIETELGVRTTYFLMLHSEFYNLLEPDVVQCIKQISALGHAVGLHFDASIYGVLDETELAAHIAFEKSIIDRIFHLNTNVFSFHNPDVGGCLDKDSIAGMMNAYGKTIMSQYKYCSDSNGYWRFDRLYDVLTLQVHDRLQVLTHPCWWSPEVMSPRQRINRCIEGRAKKTGNNYDAFLKKNGRLNIGLEEIDTYESTK